MAGNNTETSWPTTSVRGRLNKPLVCHDPKRRQAQSESFGLRDALFGGHDVRKGKFSPYRDRRPARDLRIGAPGRESIATRAVRSPVRLHSSNSRLVSSDSFSTRVADQPRLPGVQSTSKVMRIGSPTARPSSVTCSEGGNGIVISSIPTTWPWASRKPGIDSWCTEKVDAGEAGSGRLTIRPRTE